MSKTYRAGLLLGARSDTDDADGTVTPVVDAAAPDEATLSACFAGFVGEIEQVPPAFSAAKVTGQRAYDLARRGEEVTLRPRTIHVHAIHVSHYDYPSLELEIHCGKGTYVRSLARDLGVRLGCGALVQTLRRTCVGPFTVENAVTLDSDAERARARLLPVGMAVVELLRLVLPDEDLKRLCQGQSVELAHQIVGEEEVAVFDEGNRLAAVAKFDPASKCLRPAKVIHPTSPKR
jgi:tRNA pseudouridine55 synthase